MSLTLSEPVRALLSSRDSSLAPIDEVELGGQIDQAAGDVKALSAGERKATMAEIYAFKFQTMSLSDRAPWDSYFGPMAVFARDDGTVVYVPDAADVDWEVIRYWSERSEAARHPVLKARYADLWWEMGRFWNRTHADGPRVAVNNATAKRAISAYLESVATGVVESDHQAWRFLGRATELSLRIKDASLAEAAKTAAFTYERQQAATGKPTMWWQLDDLVWNHRELEVSDAEHRELIHSLEAALVRYSNAANPQTFDPHHALSIADRLRRRYAKSDQRQASENALRTAGAAFETMAAGAAALTATAWLQELLIRYRDQGMNGDASRVEAAIRSRSAELVQSLKRISLPIEMSPTQFSTWVEQVTEGSLAHALAKIARALITKEATIRDTVLTGAAHAPLSAHIPIEIMGHAGFRAATIGSVVDDLPGRMLHQAADIIGMSAPFLHAVLDRAKERLALDADDVFAYVVAGHCFPTTHSLLREGIDAWFAGDFVKAIHVLIPQVEAALREIAQSLGESVMRPTQKGGFDAISMSAILRTTAFATKFDPSARLHLRALYSEPEGINLRNKLAHGLASPELFGAGVANWVIHSLLLLGSMRLTDSLVQTSGGVDRAP